MKNKQRSAQRRRAVVLLSGGIDSATVLYWAIRQGYRCHCLIFDYGQRHRKEIRAAQRIARAGGCKATVIPIRMPWKGSSLLDKGMDVPAYAAARFTRAAKTIPSTYVPARNIIFLSFALSFAESIGAGAIFIGAHMQDYSDYPDCRREFFRAFGRVITTGTKAGSKGRPIRVYTPLLDKSKAAIIALGLRLKVPFALTWSCYRGGLKPCGACDSCHFRMKGFQANGVVDPAL